MSEYRDCPESFGGCDYDIGGEFVCEKDSPMTYACMECGEGLPQYKAGYCARCIADEEALEYEAEDAEEGRAECEREPGPDCGVGFRLKGVSGYELELELDVNGRTGSCFISHMMLEALTAEWEVITKREYGLSYDDCLDLDIQNFNAGLPVGSLSLPLRNTVKIPKDLGKLVLAELSPQWHTKAVRELLKLIEEQL